MGWDMVGLRGVGHKGWEVKCWGNMGAGKRRWRKWGRGHHSDIGACVCLAAATYFNTNAALPAAPVGRSLCPRWPRGCGTRWPQVRHTRSWTTCTPGASLSRWEQGGTAHSALAHAPPPGLPVCWNAAVTARVTACCPLLALCSCACLSCLHTVPPACWHPSLLMLQPADVAAC